MPRPSRVGLFDTLAALFGALALCGCGALPLAGGRAPAISGYVFRDLDGDGLRDAREPGEPGVTVSAFDATETLVATTTTDVNGDYVLKGPPGQVGIVRGLEYTVVFSGWADHLSPGPHGADSGTEQQFVQGGATGVRLGLSNPDQYVPSSHSAGAADQAGFRRRQRGYAPGHPAGHPDLGLRGRGASP